MIDNFDQMDFEELIKGQKATKIEEANGDIHLHFENGNYIAFYARKNGVTEMEVI